MSNQYTAIDLTGMRFGRLLVQEMIPGNNSGSPRRYKCLCDCGNLSYPSSGNLQGGKTTSCGCYSKEKVKRVNITHGLAGHPLHKKWISIRERCYCPNNQQFKDYGGRGIIMEEPWYSDFKTFYDWALVNGWKPGLTIDRKDVNGNYGPNNCQWATLKQQANNKRCTIRFPVLGEMLTKAEVVDKYGVKRSTIKYFTNLKGVSLEDVVKRHLKNVQ